MGIFRDEEEQTVIEFAIGEYEIIIFGKSDRATAQIKKDGDTLFDDVLPRSSMKVLDHERKMDAIETARYVAVGAYYDITTPVDGLLDINALLEHPLNSCLYGEDEGVSDLVELMRGDDGQVFELTVNDKGQVLSGNRRLKAAIAINKECDEAGEVAKYEFLTAKIVTFDSPESELKYMILHNQSRRKTVAQVAAETKTLLGLASNSAVPDNARMTTPEMIERVRANLGGASRFTAFSVQKAFKEIEKYEDEELKKDLEELAISVPNKAKDLVSLEPPKGVEKEDYHRKVLERVKSKPAESVKRAAKVVSSELAIAAMGEPTEDDSPFASLIQKARLSGAKASDDRKTPKEIVEMAYSVMNGIDCDPFVMLTDPGHTMAKTVYTILDDGFTKPFEGNVFSNPPFSRASDAIARHDAEIRSGHTKKLFLILPASVTSTKSYHKFLQGHNPLVWQPNKRFSFEPGEMLKEEDPTATADGNREPSIVLFWSENEEDYRAFHDAAISQGWIGQAFTPFNPMRLPGILEQLRWQDSENGITCNVYGVPAAVVTVGKKGYQVKIGDRLYPDIIKTLEIAEAAAIQVAIEQLDPAF